MSNATTLYWKVHLPNLLNEMGSNDTMWILSTPIMITKGILEELADYANKLGDEKLIAFCGRLGLYEASIPGKEGHKELTKLMNKYFK